MTAAHGHDGCSRPKPWHESHIMAFACYPCLSESAGLKAAQQPLAPLLKISLSSAAIAERGSPRALNTGAPSSAQERPPSAPGSAARPHSPIFSACRAGRHENDLPQPSTSPSATI